MSYAYLPVTTIPEVRPPPPVHVWASICRHISAGDIARLMRVRRDINNVVRTALHRVVDLRFSAAGKRAPVTMESARSLLVALFDPKLAAHVRSLDAVWEGVQADKETTVLLCAALSGMRNLVVLRTGTTAYGPLLERFFVDGRLPQLRQLYVDRGQVSHKFLEAHRSIRGLRVTDGLSARRSDVVRLANLEALSVTNDSDFLPLLAASSDSLRRVDIATAPSAHVSMLKALQCAPKIVDFNIILTPGLSACRGTIRQSVRKVGLWLRLTSDMDEAGRLISVLHFVKHHFPFVAALDIDIVGIETPRTVESDFWNAANLLADTYFTQVDWRDLLPQLTAIRFGNMVGFYYHDDEERFVRVLRDHPVRPSKMRDGIL